MNPQSVFCRRLEAEYESAVALALADGAGAEQAHSAAFERVKARGNQVLDELRRAGLYPFTDHIDNEVAGARVVPVSRSLGCSSRPPGTRPLL